MTRAIITLLVAMCTGAAFAGDPCVDAEGDCFEPNDTPGCDDQDCCEMICAVEPFCCDVEWDPTCVFLAEENCDPPVCPGKGSCFEPHEEPGCDDEDCCNIVCGLDPFCCSGDYDPICVGVAQATCATGFCTIDIPPAAEDELEPCGERLNNGCNEEPNVFRPIACGDLVTGTTWATGIRDTDWYELDLASETEITFRCTAEFPALMAHVQGTCDTGFFVTSVAYATGCVEGELVICAPAGTTWIVVTPGLPQNGIYNGIACDDPKIEPGVVGNRYFVEMLCGTCDSADCVADIDGDGVVEVDDLIILLSAWGPNPGHPADLDGDDVVDVDDLILVLSSWGPCE